MEEWKISLEEFLKRITMDLNETFVVHLKVARDSSDPNFSLDKPVIHAVD